MTLKEYLKDIFDRPERYRKFWVALAGFILTCLTLYFPDAPWLPALTSFLTTLGVFAAPNNMRSVK